MYFKSLNNYLDSDREVIPFKNIRLLRTLKAMKNLAPKKIPYNLVFVMLFVLTACDNDEPNDDSVLVKSGILGRWKLQSRSFDGITPLIREVGYYLTLLEDKDRSDLNGDFLSVSPGSETNGLFELNPASGTIRFEFRSDTLIYEYEVLDDVLIFKYRENGTEIEEIWVKSELIP